MIENNVIILKYILIEKQIPRNLLVLFGSTRGTPLKTLKAIAIQRKQKLPKSTWFEPGLSAEF